MPNAKTRTAQYADRTLENALRERTHNRVNVALMWEMRGPENTGVAWLSCFIVNGTLLIVETFKDGGWNALTSDRSNRVDETINDVIERCAIQHLTVSKEEAERAFAELDRRLA